MSIIQDATQPFDATRIAPGIHMGSAPKFGDSVSRHGYNVLVLCAMEYQPGSHCFPGVRVIHCPLDDAMLTEEEFRRALQTAQTIIQCGGRVLVTCMQGRNRSGLVTALALHLMTKKPGTEIVDHIQKRRYNALSNQTFATALRRLK